ncbi:mechanosensitive ion channel domain-containing protein [Marivivens marinus]|uniref:mechanosensitive ion channel domain-containing protein n=1 Tax=Marivivens marinus TaxID=3110173 RepID=UPI003B845F4D
MRLFHILLICLSLFLSPTLAPAQTAEAPSGPITTESSATDDAAIATRIRDIIGELGGYEDVTVQVSDGIVTLRGTATSAAEIDSLTGLATRVQGVVAVKNEVTETGDLARRLDPAMDRFLARVEQLITLLPLILIALAAFLFVAFLGRILARMKQPWDRLAPNAFIAELYRQIVLIVFVVAGLVIALDILNATALLSTILGAAGIVGLAIGFAVRDTVENYIASVLLSIRQPFRPNDTVEINGDQGKVIRLTSRATILLSFDGNHIRIPNSTVFKSRIINFTQQSDRRFMFDLLVDPGADLSQARTIAAETVQALPFVLAEPAAQAWIEGIDPGGAQIKVTGWIDQHETSILLARGEALRLVKRGFEEAGIDLVNAVQRVLLEGAPGPETAAQQAAAAAPEPTESAEVATVETTNETALDKMIDAEREQDETEDLLTEDATKE